MPLLLTESQVRQLLSMSDLITEMERALVQFSSGSVTQPLRTVLSVGTQRAFFGVMPAHAPATHALGAKVVTVFEGNHALGLPSHLATILLFDDETGALLAIMDGRLITETRTAAASAVSVRVLRPDTSRMRLGLLGSGVQARSHVEAMLAIAAVDRIRVWSPNADHCDAFANEVRERHGVPVEVERSARRAAEDADVVVLATSAREPVLADEWVPPGVHIVSVGACRPDQREMEPALVARARLFVDSRDAALAESGDIVMGIADGRFAASHILAELGTVAAGRAAGRESPDDVTIFKSLGLAVEDVAAARLAYERALGAGVGTSIEL